MLKFCEILNIILSSLVSGMYLDPWLALTRSLKTFEADFFLAIVKQMNRNMESLMTVLIPVSLLSAIPVLILSFNEHATTFYLTLTGLILFIIALLVTVIAEVPIVKQIVTWNMATLPGNWQQLRDRWTAFHIIRVLSGVLGLMCVVAGAII